MMRPAAPSTYILAPRSDTPPSGTPPLLPIPLPTSSLPLLLPSTDCRADVPEVALPPRKRWCIAPYVEIRHDPEREISYGIIEVWVDPDEIVEEISTTDVAELSQRMPTLDRRAHAHTTRLMETEARLSCEAWVQSMDASDTARSEVMALHTTMLAHQDDIGAFGLQTVHDRDPAHPDVPEEAGSSS
nr:hypothetical protein [Tanacetum cinerariifolium]